MLKFNSYEQLQAYLRGWMSFHCGPRYDAAGALTLTLALLDNLRQHVLEGELEDFLDGLSTDQSALILKLTAQLTRPSGAACR